MKIGCTIVALLGLLLGGLGPILYTHYEINRDIVGWKGRAQVSSEPNDMFQYMSNVRSGMEKRGMTNGYAGILFVTPETDMSLIYRAVIQHVDQAKVLTTMNRTTPEYQTGLDNLRGSIRELDLHVIEFWNYHDGLVFWFVFIGSIIAFLGALWSWLGSIAD